MRVLTAKYGFIVTVLLIWLFASTKSNSSCKTNDRPNAKNEINNGVLGGLTQSSNYIKYFFNTSAGIIPTENNPAVIKAPDRSFISIGQTFVSCGSNVLVNMDVKNDAEKNILSLNIPVVIGQDQSPQELNNVLMGLTIGDEKTYLSNLSNYSVTLTNYKDYSSQSQYLASMKVVSINNGVVNKYPFFFTQKNVKKTQIPSCKSFVEVEYTIYNLLTSVIVLKQSVNMKYADLSQISLSYPLLGIGINNITEVVTKKNTILLSMHNHPLYNAIKNKLDGHKDEDNFVIQANIVKVI